MKLLIEKMGLRLRVFVESDVPLKVRWINDPEVHRYLHYDLPLEAEKTQNWSNRIKDKTDRHDLVIESPPGRPVGLIGLLNIDPTHKTAEFYIAIGEKRCWGKGVGKKAATLLFDWAFESLKLEKIWATTRSSNTVSLLMMKGVGFRVEGCLRREKHINGNREDILRVGILKDEYTANRLNPAGTFLYERIPMISDMTPTPLVRAANLGNRLGAETLYFKRDDLLGRVLGGNKLRKLSYILPKAISQKADVLITTGSFESNHVCVTAVAARMLGMQPAMVLMGPEGEKSATLNERLQRKLGTEIRAVYFDPVNRQDLGERVERAVEQLTCEYKEKGMNPFFVPPAGCCLEGTYAYVDAFDELHDQMLQEGHCSYDIIIAVGTGSTLGGLWCGTQRRGADVLIYGVSIARKNPRCIEETIAAASRVCDKIEQPAPQSEQLRITDAYIGGGYAAPTALSAEAIDVAFETEGLLLDYTYTGKALGGLIDMIRKNEIGTRPVVFWHTGGVANAIDSIVAKAEDF